jgi:CRP-like cAMP-binding protein
MYTMIVRSIMEAPFRSVPFFESCEDGFLAEVAESLELQIYNEGNCLFMAEEAATRLFFVQQGEVELVDLKRLQVFGSRKECVVGDGEFFTRTAYCCSARCKSKCDIFVLSFEVCNATHLCRACELHGYPTDILECGMSPRTPE